MAEEIKNQTRRSAIKTAAQVAVTAPAVGLLLSTAAQARVGIHYGDDGQTTYSSDDQGRDDTINIVHTGLSDDFYTY